MNYSIAALTTKKLSRRDFMHLLKTSLLMLLTATTMAASAISWETVEQYRKRQETATPKSVISWLKAGNERWVLGMSKQGGFGMDHITRRENSAKGQRPLAVVLSCIDSRTTPELVFDVSAGDLFTTRVGANVINDDILGSMEIAIDSGAKVIVVMGHTRCGGIAAACAGDKLEHFTQLLDRIQPVIKDVNTALDADPTHSAEIGERISSNPKYIKEVSHANAVNSYKQILAKSNFIREKVNKGEVKLVPAMYDVDSGKVTFGF